uniref:Uncharacterized protein n=1 Tax=Anguilla anguilla TaxID=7936 RepID=A0A0E9PHD4_ANGAN
MLIGSRPVNAKCGKYYVNECKKKCRKHVETLYRDNSGCHIE